MFAQANDFTAKIAHGLLDAATTAAHAEHLAELAAFQAGMRNDRLHFGIKNTHHGAVPACPDLCADVLGRHFVISAFDFDIAVAVDTAAAFFKAGEQTLRQSRQGALFARFEVGANLSFGGAVDALVGDVGGPPPQVFIDLGQALEVLAFQSVVFGTFWKINEGCYLAEVFKLQRACHTYLQTALNPAQGWTGYLIQNGLSD